MQASADHTPRRPVRQDTFDLRDQIVSDDQLHYGQSHMDNSYPSDEEHSVLEDDSDGEDREEYLDDDDGSSSLSIPNESINFDLVYALHSFAATVEGQANVVKGDSLILMDDTNSYWWLVRVLKTEEVGYIPAENIETPFERLARLNKHRNVDLAQATQAEKEEVRDRLRENLSSRAGSNQATPSPTPGTNVRSGSRNRLQRTRSVVFIPSFSVHRYPPAVWNEEEEEDEDIEWDDEPYTDEDPELAEELELERQYAEDTAGLPQGMEPDDGMSWEDGAVQDMQQANRQQQQQQQPVVDLAMEERLERQTQPLVIQQSPEKQRVAIIPDDPVLTSPPSPRSRDPAQATETKKLSLTPSLARDITPQQQTQQQQQPGGPLLPSAFMQQQQEDRKRTREEIEALEEAQRKKLATGKGKGPVSSSGYSSAPEQTRPAGGAKLRKERDQGPATDDESIKEKDKKKKSGGGVFGGLFGRRKDKKEKNSPTVGVSESASTLSVGSNDTILRGSEESGKSSSQQHGGLVEPASPVTASARQQQQQAMAQQQQQNLAIPQDRQGAQSGELSPQSALSAQISQHANQLRQRDQQQQLLYQQYLNRSPSSPPEAQPSYGLQSASAVLGGSASFPSPNNSLSPGSSRPRPGSLVLSPTAMEGQGLPDLSVVRIFAGNHLQTEATFKTVLLNASTTATDLVRQAIQRFRIPGAENEGEYYLTIKQVEGSSAVIRPDEKPLVVFESLVEAALELPKVKRSSVGSISSVASNLSMHPAIKKLHMNDFTDDSAVKLYLNRKGGPQDDEYGDDGDVTLLAESTHDDEESNRGSGSGPFLSVTTAGGGVSAERFSSPSVKFSLQLVIHPDDLPEDMIFDPQTEAIIFKSSLRDRNIRPSPGLSQSQRKKVFTFPKNITVAEVIEISLERFGIVDGVVDGGDEVEDKLSKRRSSSRVRYCLHVDINGKERELTPASKVIEAFPRPPAFRIPDRRDAKRRSADSAQLLGSIEDISPEDPVFILRRATTYKPSSRHRSSAPLDELELSRLHRESVSTASVTSDSTAGPDEPKRQMSKQEIIAAQRAATRANQKAILSTEANAARGLDVTLPTRAIIRSARYDVGDRMRYSYIEPDGETYDISDIVEEEWRNEANVHKDRNGSDLLHGVLSRGKDGLGARLDRVLSKIKREGAPVRSAIPQPTSASTIQSIDSSVRSRSPSVYSTAEGGPDGPGSRSATPNAHALNNRSPTSPTYAAGQRVTSPTTRSGSAAGTIRSDTPGHRKTPSRPKLYLPADDFGVTQMLAVIETRARLQLGPREELPPLDPVDELLFGREIKPEKLHPTIREIYSPAFKQLQEMDDALDELLAAITRKR